MTPPVISNASTQITDKALIELVRRLEPFFKSRSGKPRSLIGWGDVGDDCAPLTFPFGDTFDRADGPIGADWARGPSTTANWTIASDQAQFAGGLVEDILFLPAGKGTDLVVEVSVPAFPRTHQAQIGPGARLQNTYGTIGDAAGYYVLANQRDGVQNALEIWKRRPNAITDLLVSFAVPTVPLFEDGDRVGIRVTGTGPATTIEALLNGDVIGAFIDDDVTYGRSFNSGFVGLYANTNSSLPKVVFDEFKAGPAGGFFDYVKFGDGLKVTDEGSDTIRVDACDVDSIRFDTANTGGYLDVATSESDGDGYGQHYTDTGGGILHESTGFVQSKVGDTELFVDGSGARVSLPPGALLQVLDGGNASIFEVREDGTVHIPTGTSVLADL